MIQGSVETTLLILLVIIVAGPIIAERFRVPGLIGLIAGGMVVGPFVLGWVHTDGLMSQLGEIGLLYLMFLAGISFNMRAFFENRTTAVVYGLLGFAIPFVLSVFVAMSFSDLGILAAALIGAMWASNTLVAYPDVVARGLQNNRAVSAAVSAGVVADLLSLTVLAFASSTAAIDIEGDVFSTATVENPALPIYLGLPILVGFTLWLLPKIAEWFFVRIGHTRGQRFVFSLVCMAAGASVALIGGVEGLIGAFLAGFGMNRLVPARGGLMDRLEFVGGTLFIPAFLVSIGLSVDPGVLFDRDTLILAVLFTALVVVGKTIAASITGAVFRIPFDEIGLMSSLSVGQAASTLAIAQVGIELGFFGQNIVNAAVLTIVSTALITSFGTRFFAGRVERPAKSEMALGDSVLVDIRANGSDLSSVMLAAGLIARGDDGLSVPYAVPDVGLKEASQLDVDGAVRAAASHGYDTSGHVRVDASFSNGTLRLVEEDDASLVMLSWQGLRFPSDLVFGNEIDDIGAQCPVPTAAVRILRPWNRVIAALGDVSTDWKNEDSLTALTMALRLASLKDCRLLVVTTNRALIDDMVAVDELVDVVETDDLRHNALASLDPSDVVVMPAHTMAAARGLGQWRLARTFRDVSLIVVGGPHRLTVSTARARTNARSFVGPTTGSINDSSR